VNASRISEIRQKIADGSYQIDAARIADSLINAARDLFIRRR
jgi:flagellar biosynthesis anti-sigma factor FlgM